MFKTALVVDDSRTAQVTLARLLKAQGLLVDTAESGPEALDYLRLNPPPIAIFLDHMMPGMDGFETLGVLKSNQATASIPVVMYTSKEDVSYSGEALALGAAGVLQKPPQSADVGRILATLTAARASAPATVVVESESRAAVRPAGPSAAASSNAGDGEVVSNAAAHVAAAPPVVELQGGVRGWIIMLACLTAIAAFAAWWSFGQYRDALQARDTALAQRERLKDELDQRVAAARREVKTPPAPVAPAINRALLDAVAWVFNQQGHYDFDEVPLNDGRLQLLQGLIERLTAAGFRGTIRIDTYLGEFCVVRDDQGRQRLPPLGTPMSSCEVVSYPTVEANRLAQRKSEAFSRYLADRAQAGGPIDIVVASHGTSQPLRNPADLSDVTSAAEWNAAARLNQRIEMSLLPKERPR